MKRMVVGAALLAAAPFAAQAQSLQPGGVYVGLEGGANWIFNSSFNITFTSPCRQPSARSSTNASWNTGYVLGGAARLRLRRPSRRVGRRLPREQRHPGVRRRRRQRWHQLPADQRDGQLLLRLHGRRSAFVPYVGVGAGVAFLNAGALGNAVNSTQFAYQAMVGVGYNINEIFRVNLEGRYMGTTTPNFTHSGSRAAPTSRSSPARRTTTSARC